MNIVFRVDSSSQIGTGHLMRCLVLANELKRKKHQVIFICRELKGNLISSVDFKVLILPKDVNFKSNNLNLNLLGATQEQDVRQTNNILPKDTDVLIVDNYALDEVWHKQLRLYVNKIMIIDDLADRNFDCDILLNQNLGIQEENYKGKVSSNCKLLLGCNYVLMRPEFAKLRLKALEKRKNTKEIKNILISMGGSDKNNITYDILQQIGSGLSITVVLGEASQYKEMIKDYAKDRNIKVIVNANNMAELMLNSDLAIGAGGSTSWERCCLGLPTLLFVTSENQKSVAMELQKLRAVTIVTDFENDLKAITMDIDNWKNMSSKAYNVCDGLGVKNIVEFI